MRCDLRPATALRGGDRRGRAWGQSMVDAENSHAVGMVHAAPGGHLAESRSRRRDGAMVLGGVRLRLRDGCEWARNRGLGGQAVHSKQTDHDAKKDQRLGSSTYTATAYRADAHGPTVSGRCTRVHSRAAARTNPTVVLNACTAAHNACGEECALSGCAPAGLV